MKTRFYRNVLRAVSVTLLMPLAACITTTPSTSVHQPMTVRPPAVAAPAAGNGAIYQAGYTRPLFEDRRARNVGDTLTVNIVENTSADKKSNTTTNRSSDNNFGVTNVSGLPGKSFLGAGLAAKQFVQIGPRFLVVLRHIGVTSRALLFLKQALPLGDIARLGAVCHKCYRAADRNHSQCRCFFHGGSPIRPRSC